MNFLSCRPEVSPEPQAEVSSLAKGYGPLHFYDVNACRVYVATGVCVLTWGTVGAELVPYCNCCPYCTDWLVGVPFLAVSLIYALKMGNITLISN